MLVDLVLRDRERVAPAGLRAARPAARARRSVAQRVGVEADAVADAAGGAPAVAERQGRRRPRPARRAPTPAPRPRAPPAVARTTSPVASAERAAVAGPSSDALSQVSFGERARQLLQPAVVGEAAVVDATDRRRTAATSVVVRRPARGAVGTGARRQRDSAGAALPRDHAGAQRSRRHERASKSPPRWPRRRGALPGACTSAWPSRRRRRRASASSSMRRARVVERRDRRLQQRRRAVVAERVAPALVVVRQRQVPVGQRARSRRRTGRSGR